MPNHQEAKNITGIIKTGQGQPPPSIMDRVTPRTAIDMNTLPGKRIRLSEILKIVGNYCDVTEKQMCAKGRAKELSEARHIAIWITRQTTSMSFPNIAARFGFDHRSTMYAERKVSSRREHDDFFRLETNAILAEVEALRFKGGR